MDDSEYPHPTTGLTRAMVTGKIPNAAKGQARGVKTARSPRERKTTTRRLKRKGLISEKAAKSYGL
jgi:hypothetical protein